MNNNVIFSKTRNNQFDLHSKKFHSLIKFMKDISNRTKILSQYLQNKNVFIKDVINSIINFVKCLYDSNDILIKYYKEYYKQMNIIEIMKLDDNQMKNYLIYIYESKMCKTNINNLYKITTEI